MKRTKKKTAKEKIIEALMEDGHWGPCYICLQVYGRIRLTENYCRICDDEEWFCTEHGTFRGGTIGYCLLHDKKLSKHLTNKN